VSNALAPRSSNDKATRKLRAEHAGTVLRMHDVKADAIKGKTEWLHNNRHFQ
jgi:hypothetical protein